MIGRVDYGHLGVHGIDPCEWVRICQLCMHPSHVCPMGRHLGVPGIDPCGHQWLKKQI